MAEIFAQKDLDALITSLLDDRKAGGSSSTADADIAYKKLVRAYDFKRPDKFSRDQIRTVEMLHENIARLCSTYLAAQVRALTTISISSVDAMSFAEFTDMLPNPGYIATIGMEPLKGQMFIFVDIPVALVMVDRLFGGPGLVRDVGRALTEIETAIVNRLTDGILSSVKEGWKALAPVEPRLEDVTSNPTFIQKIAANEMTVVVKYEMKVGKAVGTMTFCIPFMTLEPILPRLHARNWFGSRHDPAKADVEGLLAGMKRVELGVSVELGHAKLRVRDILDMEPGDVIELESRVTAPVRVLVEGIPKFIATPGRAGKKLCVRIESVIKEENHE